MNNQLATILDNLQEVLYDRTVEISTKKKDEYDLFVLNIELVHIFLNKVTIDYNQDLLAKKKKNINSDFWKYNNVSNSSMKALGKSIINFEVDQELSEIDFDAAKITGEFITNSLKFIVVIRNFLNNFQEAFKSDIDVSIVAKKFNEIIEGEIVLDDTISTYLPEINTIIDLLSSIKKEKSQLCEITKDYYNEVLSDLGKFVFDKYLKNIKFQNINTQWLKHYQEDISPKSAATDKTFFPDDSDVEEYQELADIDDKDDDYNVPVMSKRGFSDNSCKGDKDSSPMKKHKY